MILSTRRGNIDRKTGKEIHTEKLQHAIEYAIINGMNASELRSYCDYVKYCNQYTIECIIEARADIFLTLFERTQ